MDLRTILLLVFLIAIGACSSLEEHVVSSLFKNYGNAQEALASDNFEEAKQALEALARESEGDVKEAAGKLATAADISEARAQFKWLSQKVAEMDLPEGYVVAFCPMADQGKGATWVQKDGEIANPYFGKEMLTCGTIQKGKD